MLFNIILFLQAVDLWLLGNVAQPVVRVWWRITVITGSTSAKWMLRMSVVLPVIISVLWMLYRFSSGIDALLGTVVYSAIWWKAIRQAAEQFAEDERGNQNSEGLLLGQERARKYQPRRIAGLFILPLVTAILGLAAFPIGICMMGVFLSLFTVSFYLASIWFPPRGKRKRTKAFFGLFAPAPSTN